MKTTLKTIVITPGDPEGIGPEVTAKALIKLASALKKISIHIYASKKPFKKWLPKLKSKNIIFFEPPTIEINEDNKNLNVGGYQSGWAIEAAATHVIHHQNSSVLVTGPIHKMRLQEGGYRYQGHTDFLAHLCSQHIKKEIFPTMMLTNHIFRVSLLTDHCSINAVSNEVTVEKILKTIENTYLFLKNTLKIKKPKIAIMGLNPHAGEEGLMGVEESQTIIPAIEMARLRHRDALFTGPFSADSFFGMEYKNILSKQKSKSHDAIIAMYHDQGLIPVKLLGFHHSLNLTLGLPIVRISVDHGTGFDIAGKNKADADSMIHALKTAIQTLSQKRKAHAL